jgi:pheromone shutdown protein TraB
MYLNKSKNKIMKKICLVAIVVISFSLKNYAQENSQLTTVLDHYFLLKDALVKTNAGLASAKAKDLYTAIQSVKIEKLNTDTHTVWMKMEKELTEDAEHIHESNDIAHQRDHFMNLSKNIYTVIKASKVTEPVYYQFCPMANKGKGANWLSKEMAIKNPYYGSQMLSCGRTVETIKQ